RLYWKDMRHLVIVMALAAPFVRAQAPDQMRGTVNGKPVSQAQLEALINLVPEQQRPAISGNPEELLRFYGFVEKMAEEANKEKLAEKSPYKEQLEVGRTHALAVAEMENYSRNISISTEEADRYYQQHKDSFSTANITVAQVPI